MVEMVVLPIDSLSFFQRSVMGLISFVTPAGNTSTKGTAVTTLLAAALMLLLTWWVDQWETSVETWVE